MYGLTSAPAGLPGATRRAAGACGDGLFHHGRARRAVRHQTYVVTFSSLARDEIGVVESLPKSLPS
jgi:hypothetical protein